MSNDQNSDASTDGICCYRNYTQRIQIGKVAYISRSDLEKVIFPGETFLFEALVEAQLEIFTNLADTTTLLDKISCSRLQTKVTTNTSFELVE